jgi:gamma-glutamyltranspeptidase/glutathione hydrolase
MTPTILLKDGKPYLVTGSPGGSRIITTVLQVLINAVDRGMDVASAESAPRIHNQWMPDQVFAEPGVSPGVIEGLEKRGDKVVPTPPFTAAASIMATPEGFAGAVDPRSHWGLAAGY